MKSLQIPIRNNDLALDLQVSRMKNKIIASLNIDRLRHAYIDVKPPQTELLPVGPIKRGDESCVCSLLIFVPRNADSLLINMLTGGYGYSHLAVDCGEVDVPSGKRVMIESTSGLGVHNSFQDEYGERKFVRIPLEKVGIPSSDFCNCVRAKLGEKFDNEETITFGLVHDPSKQICSDLATVCLPETMRRDMARYQQTGLLYHLSTLWPHQDSNKVFRLFVSPNGFAKYFGIPKGDQLLRPNELFDPVLPALRH